MDVMGERKAARWLSERALLPGLIALDREEVAALDRATDEI